MSTEEAYQWCETKGGAGYGNDVWENHNHTFGGGDVVGARYLLFEDGGVDSEYYKGLYGPWFKDASVVLGLLTGRRRSSQLAQIRPELVEATVAGVALRLSANQPVDDGDLDSLPQHDVVQKLCATLDDAFAALGHYSEQDGYAWQRENCTK